MRQYRSLPPKRPQQQPPPELPPQRLETPRRRFGRLYTRFRNVFLIGVGILMTLAALLLYDTTRPPSQRLTQRDINAAVARALASATPEPSYSSQAYEIIHPSVVLVRPRFFLTGPNSEGRLGTGVVIDERGIILTSLHVIEDAVGVTVVFANGMESEATVLVRQPENDLAVLEAQEIPDDLLPATLASSATLRVGDEVVAVGNPFGISNSLSAGVVSGLGRRYRSKTGETLANLIQFDAAVNPGNSGGPLVNRNGEVVGIVTALLNPTDQDVFIGIGFAVPIDTAAAAAGSPPY